MCHIAFCVDISISNQLNVNFHATARGTKKVAKPACRVHISGCMNCLQACYMTARHWLHSPPKCSIASPFIGILNINEQAKTQHCILKFAMPQILHVWLPICCMPDLLKIPSLLIIPRFYQCYEKWW